MMIGLLQPRPEVLDQPIVDLSSLDLVLAARLTLVYVGAAVCGWSPGTIPVT